jgi:prevent-host-death family protein
MTTITAEEARGKLSDILNRAAYRNEPTILTRHGKGVAAVISLSDFELLEKFIKKTEDRIDSQAIRDALKQFEAGDTISLDELRVKLGI